MLAGALFSFSPPLHTSPPRLFTGWEEDINAARFQRFSTGKEPVAKRDSSVFPSRWILFNTQSKRRNKMSIQFKNRDHERFYQQCLVRCGCGDPYHKAFFYTMGISDETRKHVEDVFDFQGGCYPAGGDEQRLADQRKQLSDPFGIQPLERVERRWLCNALRSVHHIGCSLYAGSNPHPVS